MYQFLVNIITSHSCSIVPNVSSTVSCPIRSISTILQSLLCSITVYTSHSCLSHCKSEVCATFCSISSIISELSTGYQCFLRTPFIRIVAHWTYKPVIVDSVDDPSTVTVTAKPVHEGDEVWSEGDWLSGGRSVWIAGYSCSLTRSTLDSGGVMTVLDMFLDPSTFHLSHGKVRRH